MSDEPELRRTNDDGGKFYEHPTRTNADGSPMLFDSVTTVLGLLDKDALKQWSANLAARRAAEHLPMLLRAARVDPCGNSRKRDNSACKECLDCLIVWCGNTHFGETARRAREGTLVHRMKSWWIKTDGETRYQRELDDDPPWEVIKPYWEQFLAFVADYGLKPGNWEGTELTVFGFVKADGSAIDVVPGAHLSEPDPAGTRPGWGGTLDGILRIEPTTAKAHEFCARLTGQLDPGAVVIVEDVKSRERVKGDDSIKIYREVPLQLAPYRWAHHMIPRPSDVEFPMPHTDGGAVLQLRPDGYEFRPVRTDTEVLDGFIELLRAYRRMQKSNSWVRLDAFPKPPGYVYPPKAKLATAVPDNTDAAARVSAIGADVPAKKAAPRKRAAKKATVSMTGSVTAQAPLDRVLATGDRRPGGQGSFPDVKVDPRSPVGDDIPF